MSKYRILTDETGKRIAEAVEGMAEAQGATVGDGIEYGFRWVSGASSPVVERVTRQNGVISPWNISFTTNVGGTVNENAFDYISLFAPKDYTDGAGNRFKRFARFYIGRQTIGVYSYVWLCKKQVAAFYVLPRAFKRAGVPYWNYRDIGVYEAGKETVDGTTYLTSKTGLHPAHNINRTTANNYAKAIGTRLGIDTEQEQYSITTMSEIVELMQPLLLLMYGTKNSDGVYKGVQSVFTTATPVESYDAATKTITLAAGTASKYVVGGVIECNTTGGTDSNYRTITEIGDLYIVHDGDAFETLTQISGRPNKTGQTDTIDATHGTEANDGKHSFKALGIENIFGNTWAHILDVTIYDLVPYICDDLDAWTDTTTPASNAAFKKCSYTLANREGYAKALGYDAAYPDVQLTTEVGGSSTTYYCDYYYQNGLGAKTVLHGGRLSSGARDGLFYWDVSDGVGGAYWNIGARLSHAAL